MEKYLTLLYYKYAWVPEPEAYTQEHLKFCKCLGLNGRVLIADEGINGTVSGTVASCEAYMDNLKNNPVFTGIVFKIDAVEKPSFHKMHVRYRKEVCHFGIKGAKADPVNNTGVHLTPEEFMKQKDAEDVMIVDMRNKVEYDLGHFKNAIELEMDSFREFPDKAKELEQYKDKKIFAYCTGGIRCEKATAFLLSEGFTNVFQLEGGIIEYGKQTGGKDFDGKCYVFDARLSVDVNSVNPVEISKCYTCGITTSRMINCSNPECNNHVCMCETCGWEMNGACTESCKSHPRIRKYDGSGYYLRGVNSK